MKIKCLFCRGGDKFTTVEHIIPESLGNDDLLLENEICDKCQNYLSKIENYVLHRTPIGFWRTLYGIKTKKKKSPQVDFIKKESSKGRLPDSSYHHDNISLQSHSDFSTELVFKDNSTRIESVEKKQLKYVLTPKALHEIGRFIGKIGVELICLQDRELARSKESNSIVNYVRRGFEDELWPVFHSSDRNMEKDPPREYEFINEVLTEVIECYSYRLLEIRDYWVFNLNVGRDSWFICLNQQFPHPTLVAVLGIKTNILWYPKSSWDR